MSDEAILSEVAALAGYEPEDMMSQLDADEDIGKDQVCRLIRTMVQLRKPLVQERERL